MEASFCLRYCSLSNLPLRLPSTVNFARVGKPHISFRFSSLPLATSSRGRPVRHVHSPITCATNAFSTPSTSNNNGDNNIPRVAVRASLAMACVLGIIGCGYTMKHKAHAFLNIPSPWPAETQTAKANRLMDQMDRGAVPSKIDEQLKKAFDENPEDAYYVQMELIKMLINRGKFEDASRYCEDLSRKEIYYSPLFRKDQRFHLYKGIIHAMWYKNEGKAKESFQKYIDILNDSPLIG